MAKQSITFMNGSTVVPYGSWKSPITSELIAGGSISLNQPTIDDGEVYWIEMRPTEMGRNVVVRRDQSGRMHELTELPFSARTRVHEYGGGDYVAHQGTVYFANFVDQRLYVRRFDEPSVPLTPPADMRYADFALDATRRRLICVREDHSTIREPINTLVAIDLDLRGHCGELLVSGNDFYSSPRLSPDRKQLAWLCWDHPNMPWDGTELWIADFGADGLLNSRRQVAGGPNESIVQPEWSSVGELFFVSDKNGWWNLYRHDGRSSNPVLEMKAEFALPQWGFGMSSYSFVSKDRVVCSYVERGISHLAMLQVNTGSLQEIPCPYTDISYLRAEAERAVFRGGSPTEVASIVSLDLKGGRFEVLRRSNNLEIDSAFVSRLKAIEFPTTDGKRAYAFFYPPTNELYRGSDRELPPLLVKSHGGPTSATTTSLSLGIQYWTSRGIAVLDVNYGGSTGFGRAYRERLTGSWGIVDVDDCVNGARYLVENGSVDPARLMITGGSAGGYTTLCALTFRRVFHAGASYYGVSDAEALVRDTHKFESRYLDGLMGPYPAARQTYFDRSPVNFPDQLGCPVIFFQGLDDKIVPPNQAEVLVSALRTKGIPVAYVAFEGEQHGFRQAKNIKRALDAELYFYSRVFGFDLADEVEPVVIENMD